MKLMIIGILIAAAAAIAIILFLGFPPSNAVTNEAIIVAELRRLNMATGGAPEQMNVQLPSELSDANWGLKASVCQEGGYDLYAYAGKDVLLTSYPINQKYNNTEFLQAWVVTSGDKVVCVYRTVMDGSALTPGVFSVKDNPLIRPFKLMI